MISRIFILQESVLTIVYENFVNTKCPFAEAFMLLSIKNYIILKGITQK